MYHSFDTICNHVLHHSPCLFCSNNCLRDCASSLSVVTWALRMAFSFSKKQARSAISSSLAFLASRDFFAARLFLFLLSKYLSSFWSSGIGLFSLRGRRGRVEASARDITGEAVKEIIIVINLHFYYILFIILYKCINKYIDRNDKRILNTAIRNLHTLYAQKYVVTFDFRCFVNI